MKFALAALAFAFLPPQAESLALKSEKGAHLTKSCSIAVDLNIEEAHINVGGRELPDEVLEKFEMTMSFGGELEVEDEYVAVEGKRAKELVRHYLKATETQKSHVAFPGAAPKDEDESVESPLVGKHVAFTWDPKDEKYARAFRDDEGEKAWLEKLEEGMDFEHLLPTEKVEPGETWKIDAKDFEAITTPGGSLSFPKKKQSDSDPFDDGFKGEIEARYDGKREVDGHELAVIHVQAHLKTGKDAVESAEMPLKLAIVLELEGDYLWDQEHGRLASFGLAGTAKFELSGSKEIEVRGQKLPMVLGFKLSGECKLTGKLD